MPQLLSKTLTRSFEVIDNVWQKSDGDPDCKPLHGHSEYVAPAEYILMPVLLTPEP